jgi:hypothetical protein
MATARVRSATVILTLHHISLGLGGLNTLGCIRCGEPLELHQPDAASPGRLLGTCRVCSTWFLVEERRDGSGIVLVEFPRKVPTQSRARRGP